MTSPRSALVELTIARVRLFFREPGAVFWTFGFPVILSAALGVAFRNRAPDPVRVAVEAGPEAASVVEALRGPEIVATVEDAPGARRDLRSGNVVLVVTGGAPRTYRYDQTRPDALRARWLVDDRLQRAAGRVDPLAVSDERVAEPGGRYIDFLLPGLLGMNLMSGSMWAIGYAVVEMRVRKLIKRFVATPLRRGDFLLSMALVRLLFVFFEVPLLFAFGWLVFGVHVMGSFALLMAVALGGALSFAGLGLLVASRAQNTQTVGGLMNLVIMPMTLGSGVFFSTSNFPPVAQPFLRALPLTALNDAMRAVMAGGGLREIATAILVLAVWGVVSFALGLRFFRWM